MNEQTNSVDTHDARARHAATPTDRDMTGLRPLQEARDEVLRELTVRRRCFPQWVELGKLCATDARDRLERMEAAFHYLDAQCLCQAIKIRNNGDVTSSGDLTPSGPF